MLKLVIGNKNYSSWSMRPWVMLKQAGIAFNEEKLLFEGLTSDGGFDKQGRFKQQISKISPAGKVPVLIDGDVLVWDTLAIAEYVAEQFPDKQLWPQDKAQRARARSVCAEMHSGFGALRGNFPMNIEAALPEVGARILHEKEPVRDDVARIIHLWTGLLDAHGGPMLFGQFTIADAYYAPVVMRFKTYGVTVPAQIAAYMQHVQALPGVAAWIADALEEKLFVEEDEPYRKSREAK
jgi:glutathione S-transferase